MAESTGFTRRHFLTVATVVTGGAGAIATAVPFVASFKPSARAQALGAPVTVDISKLEPGRCSRSSGAAGAIYILHRTEEMLSDAAQRRGTCSLIPTRKKIDAARLRAERAPQHSARLSGSRGRLHAPRLRAAAALRGGARRSRSPNGRAASSARATARSSIWPDACSPASRRPRTSSCRRTATSTTARSSSAPTTGNS